MCLTGWLLTLICVYVYDITDDTSAMWDNWPIGSWHTKLLFDCFRRLILTLKQAPRMHHCQTKKIKKISGEGHSPLPRPLPYWRGGPPLLERGIPPHRSHPLGVFGASILAPSALGVPVPFHLRLEHCLRQGPAVAFKYNAG